MGWSYIRLVARSESDLPTTTMAQGRPLPCSPANPLQHCSALQGAAVLSPVPEGNTGKGKLQYLWVLLKVLQFSACPYHTNVTYFFNYLAMCMP